MLSSCRAFSAGTAALNLRVRSVPLYPAARPVPRALYLCSDLAFCCSALGASESWLAQQGAALLADMPSLSLALPYRACDTHTLRVRSNCVERALCCERALGFFPLLFLPGPIATQVRSGIRSRSHLFSSVSLLGQPGFDQCWLTPDIGNSLPREIISFHLCSQQRRKTCVLQHRLGF